MFDSRQYREELYRSIIACSPLAIISLDLAGHVLIWNPAAEALFGWTAAEVLGQPLPIVPVDKQEEFADLREIVHGGQSLLGRDVVRRNRAGELIDLSLSAAPIYDPAGRVLGIMATLKDMRSRKRMERALRASEQRFRKLFTAAAAGIVVTDARGQFLEANPAYCRLVGYSEAELRSRDFLSLTHIDDRRRNQVLHEKLLRGELSELNLEKRYVAQDGRLVWVRVSAAVVRDDHGQPEFTLAVVEDITQQKQAEANLRRLTQELEQRVHQRTSELAASNRELEAFSYSVSHDLRAPLRAIDGWAQALSDDYAAVLGSAGCDMLQRQRAASQRLGQLIDDLLSLSRLSRQPLEPKPLDLASLVQKVWRELTEDLAARPRLTLHPLPTCLADAVLLEQVLVNLLGNAIKFTCRQSDPWVEVGACTVGGEIAYHVRDNGVGFDMRYADKLFQPFQRLHSTHDFPGTGIGLAIVQRVVLRHGGRAWAEGAPGHGATVHFTLPAANADPAPDVTAQP